MIRRVNITSVFSLAKSPNNLLRPFLSLETTSSTIGSIRSVFKEVNLPKPGNKNYFRRTVHYPEKYTIKPIPTTNLGGRDPLTGRVVVGTLGGGLKHPYLWPDYKRNVPKGSPPLIEKVIEIIHDPNRTSDLALVGSEDNLRYIIATENMKRGDTIITSSELTRIAVRPNEGDAYPIGSLTAGTIVCCLEFLPGVGAFFARGAGTSCTILRKVGERVIVSIPSKREISLDPNCIAVVGRVSNTNHQNVHIGSPNNLRLLGYRPRSGLWQRKSGKHGRKIRRPPPVFAFSENLPQKLPEYRLTHFDYPYHHK